MKLLITLLISTLLLPGCSGSKEDDLDLWMKKRKTEIKGKIEPLPELKKYDPFRYNADGILNDPFKGRKAAGSAASGDGLHPDLARQKEALEFFPLESLKFVGYLEQGKKGVALIEAPDSNVYQIRIGNYIGQNYGVVTGLNRDEVAVKEMVEDGMGDYMEHRVVINPEDTNDPKDSTQQKVFNQPNQK